MKTLEEAREYLEYGDWRKIAKMMGVTRKYAIKIAGRPTSKHYNALVKSACEVAESNKSLGLKPL